MASSFACIVAERLIVVASEVENRDTGDGGRVVVKASRPFRRVICASFLAGLLIHFPYLSLILQYNGENTVYKVLFALELVERNWFYARTTQTSTGNFLLRRRKARRHRDTATVSPSVFLVQMTVAIGFHLPFWRWGPLVRQNRSKEKVLRNRELIHHLRNVHLDHSGVDLVPSFDLSQPLAVSIK